MQTTYCINHTGDREFKAIFQFYNLLMSLPQFEMKPSAAELIEFKMTQNNQNSEKKRSTEEQRERQEEHQERLLHQVALKTTCSIC